MGKKTRKLKIQKESEDKIIKKIRNLFKLRKENEAIWNRVIRDISTLFEHQEGDYHKPVRVCKFWNNNCTECEINGDRNETLSIKQHLDKIRPLSKGIINNLKKSDTWKIQWTIAIKFISSRDINEECIMYSKSDNIEIMTSD